MLIAEQTRLVTRDLASIQRSYHHALKECRVAFCTTDCSFLVRTQSIPKPRPVKKGVPNWVQ
eukprot:1550056-Amphidinium_carterae.1